MIQGFTLHDRSPSPSIIAEQAFAGLLESPKRFPPKLFYDRRGSELFERICALEEYYVPKAELEILERHVGEIARSVGPRFRRLLEFGSGSSRKTRILLDGMPWLHQYVPVDLSREFLLESCRALSREYPRLAIDAICADFSEPFGLPIELAAAPGEILAFFPGSSIGNFEPLEAERFLARVGRLIGPGGLLLVGVDRVKSLAILERAYNDREGVTAAFNLNVLERVNRDLHAGFEPARFRHRAFYDPGASRIEMGLEARCAHSVAIAGKEIRFEAGEMIHTESSYKYSPGKFSALAARAGFRLRRSWTDARRWFCVFLLEFR